MGASATTTRSEALGTLRQAKRVFIAYSHTDSRRALWVRRRLVSLRRRSGHAADTVFIDQESMRPGSSVDPGVVDGAIDASDLFVVLCGRRTAASVEVNRELERAIELRRRGALTVLPIILNHGTVPPRGIDYQVQGVFLSHLFPEVLVPRVVSGVAIAALGLLAHLWLQTRGSLLVEEQRGQSRALASAALAELSRAPDRALLLAAEANDVADTPESRKALLRSLLHSRQVIAYLHGHDAPIVSLAFDAQEHTQRLMTADRNGTVRLWTLWGEGRDSPPSAVLEIARHGDFLLYDAALDAYGKRIALAFREGLERWSVEDARIAPGLKSTFKGIVEHVRFNPEEANLSVVSKDGTTRYLWRCAWTDDTRFDCGFMDGQFDHCALPRDGRLVVGWWNGLYLARFEKDGARPIEFTGPTTNIGPIAISTGQGRVAGGTTLGEIRVWAMKTGAAVQAAQIRGVAPPTAMAFGPARTLFVGFGDGTINLYGLPSDDRPDSYPAHLIRGFRVHDAPVTALALADGGVDGIGASGDEAGRVVLWRPEGCEHLVMDQVWRAYPRDLAFDQTGRLILLSEGAVQSYLPRNDADSPSRLVEECSLRRAAESESVLSPSGGVAVLVSRRHAVGDSGLCIARRANVPVREIPGSRIASGWLPSIDGAEEIVAAVDDDWRAHAWRLADGEQVAETPPGIHVSGVVAAPGGHRLICDTGASLRAWDIAAKHWAPDFEVTDQRLRWASRLAMDAQGHRLAAATLEGAVVLVDLRSRRVTPVAHFDGIADIRLTFDPSEDLLAISVGSSESSGQAGPLSTAGVYIHDADTGFLIGGPLRPGTAGRAVAFRSDGALLAVDEGEFVSIYDLRPERLRATARRLAQRVLSPGENPIRDR